MLIFQPVLLLLLLVHAATLERTFHNNCFNTIAVSLQTSGYNVACAMFTSSQTSCNVEILKIESIFPLCSYSGKSPSIKLSPSSGCPAASQSSEVSCVDVLYCTVLCCAVCVCLCACMRPHVCVRHNCNRGKLLAAADRESLPLICMHCPKRFRRQRGTRSPANHGALQTLAPSGVTLPNGQSCYSSSSVCVGGGVCVGVCVCVCARVECAHAFMCMCKHENSFFFLIWTLGESPSLVAHIHQCEAKLQTGRV